MNISENRKERGYTLIELLITVAIIGILAAVAIPIYSGYQLKARRTVAWTDLQSLRLLEEQYFAENSTYVGGANTSALETNLPGFQPDPNSGYNYAVTLSGTTGFTATADSPDDPKAPPGSADFFIDNNNNRDF